MIFYPNYKYHRVYEVTKEKLDEMGVKALILDVDNTLTTHDNPVPDENIALWLEEMKNANIKMIILSNNTKERVTPFAKILGLPFVACGKKPLTSGIKRCICEMNCDKSEVAVIGDQIFTDILGGNLHNIKTILVEPIKLEDKNFFKFKRSLENMILKKYNKRRG